MVAGGKACGSECAEVGVGAAEDDGVEGCVEPSSSDCDGLKNWPSGTDSEGICSISSGEKSWVIRGEVMGSSDGLSISVVMASEKKRAVCEAKMNLAISSRPAFCSAIWYAQT